MEGILILNQWMMPSMAGVIWIVLGAIAIIVALFTLVCNHLEIGGCALIVGLALIVCFFIPLTNPWVPRYEIALNGATYEELQEHYNILIVNGGIFTVEDK